MQIKAGVVLTAAFLLLYEAVTVVAVVGEVMIGPEGGPESGISSSIVMAKIQIIIVKHRRRKYRNWRRRIPKHPRKSPNRKRRRSKRHRRKRQVFLPHHQRNHPHCNQPRIQRIHRLNLEHPMRNALKCWTILRVSMIVIH